MMSVNCTVGWAAAFLLELLAANSRRVESTAIRRFSISCTSRSKKTVRKSIAGTILQRGTA